MFGYHIFNFDIYDLAEEYSILLSSSLKALRNSRNDNFQNNIFCSICGFIELNLKKKKYNKNKLKSSLLSSYENPEEDIIKLVDYIVDFCCKNKKFESYYIGSILGDINGF